MEPALKLKIADDLKRAMKGGDAVARSVLRMLLSAVQNAEIARRAPLSDADIIGVIAKEARNRQESIDSFRQGNRPDLVAKEEAEMAILQGYLPRQMTRDEVTAAAREVIGAVGAGGLADKGKVMQQLMPKLKGKADGKAINEIVTELLGQ